MRPLKYLFCLSLLFGCSKSVQVASEKKPSIVSTTGMIHDLVAKIGGEHIAAHVLIKGELDPHSYELVKGDGERLDTASIIFSNGLGLEHGASLHARLSRGSNVVALGDLIFENKRDLMIVKDGIIDPHIWMDISLWALCVDSITKALSDLLPEQREDFMQQGEALKGELKQEHEKLCQSLQEMPEEKRYLVTSHDAFAYFTRAYLAKKGERWENRCVAPEGLAPEGQMSLLDIKRVVDHLCSANISVVFPESNVSRDSLRKIVSVCKKKGQSVHLVEKPLYGDALGDKESYIEMMRYNAETIKKFMGE